MTEQTEITEGTEGFRLCAGTASVCFVISVCSVISLHAFPSLNSMPLPCELIVTARAFSKREMQQGQWMPGGPAERARFMPAGSGCAEEFADAGFTD